MEQLLIIEDDIGLNQGLCKALKADDRQIISCHDLKAAREQLLCGSVSLRGKRSARVRERCCRLC